MLGSVLLSLLALAAPLSRAQDNSWHLTTAYLVANEMLDPVVSPNQQASHMHKIMGGSAMAAGYNFAHSQTASCSSVPMQADKSNYWMPELYWITNPSSPSTTFIPLPATPRFYYFLGKNSVNDPVQPFPPGLRMLVGSPDNKDTSVSSFFTTFSCHINPDFSNDLNGNDFNFARDCPYGLRIDVTFPQCWDGLNLYKSDNSHMSRTLNGNARDGTCPLSHPIRVPTIMLEYTFSPANVAPCQALAGHLAWANGDTTGGGVHADFTNGWDPAVLSAALNNSVCTQPGVDMTFDSCPPIAATMDYNAASNCIPDLGILQNPQGNSDAIPISSLPGCNPLWGATGPKPTCNPPVAPLDVSKFMVPDGAYVTDQPKNFQLPNATGWNPLACIGGVTTAMGSSVQQYSDSAMTIESCQTSCSQNSLQYSAVGEISPGSFWCFCSNTFDPTQATNQPGMCTDPCPGNKTETCGGQYVYEVYYNSQSSPQTLSYSYTPAGAQYLGCLKTNSPANQSYSFTSSTMTVEICNQACAFRNASWAGVTMGNRCACGDDFASLQNYPYLPDTQCSNACSGNSTERCGGPVQSSIYNVTAATYASSGPPHAAGWQGCYALQSGSPPLNSYSFVSNQMTQAFCATGCSELGFAYAGIQNGNTCSCGNTLTVGQKLPLSQCQVPCQGNTTITCGGSQNIDVYTTTGWPTVAQIGQMNNYPAPYLGCFVDSGAASTGTNYSYSANSMTIEICLAACQEFNYPIAALSGQSTCQCGSTPPSTQEVVTAVSCVRSCPGNAAETCGGGGYRAVYNISATLASPTTGTTPVSNSTSNSTTPASGAYQGCFSNSATGLTAYSFSWSTMTNDLCRTSCAELGYSLGATNGGSQCSCGNQWVGGSILPSSSCQTACSGSSTTLCGGSTASSLYSTAGAPPLATRPTGWLGCYSDSGSTKALSNWSYTSNTMTSTVCATACSQQGFPLAGTESGSMCLCGTSLTTSRLPQVLCSTPCSGNSNEFCGASGRMSAYNTSSYGSTSSQPSSGNNSTGSANVVITGQCYSDYSTLNGASYSSDLMSMTICSTWCKARGFAYGGVRNAAQCMCGNTSPKLLSTASSCATPCSADNTQMCGATNFANVASLNSLNLDPSGYALTTNSSGFMGCFREGSSKLLPSNVFSSNSLTAQMCVQNCQNLGYAYAGVEYATACYCSNAFNVSSGGYSVTTGQCSMACGGGGPATCGASGTIGVYNVQSTPNNQYTLRQGEKGCFAPGTMISAPPFKYGVTGLTPDLCKSTCWYQGYAYAGLTAGSTCMCSNTALWGTQMAMSTCNVACSGDATQTCGGQSSSVTVFDATSANRVNTTNDYIGCFNDAGSTRILNQYTFQSSSMTPALCENSCTYQGYNISGVELGKYCFCGNTWPAAGLLPDSTCNTPCVGLTSTMCGGSGKMNIYSGAYAKLFGGTSGAAPSSISSGPITATGNTTSTATSNNTMSITVSVTSTGSSSGSTATITTTGIINGTRSVTGSSTTGTGAPVTTSWSNGPGNATATSSFSCSTTGS